MALACRFAGAPGVITRPGNPGNLAHLADFQEIAILQCGFTDQGKFYFWCCLDSHNFRASKSAVCIFLEIQPLGGYTPAYAPTARLVPQGFAPWFPGGLATVLPTAIRKAFLAVSLRTELLSETPHTRISQDFRINAMFFKYCAHEPPTGCLVVGHTLELRREADSVTHDAGNIRAAAEFRNLFCVKWFLGHGDLPFSPD